MPTIESLEAKRASLHSHLEQHIGQINRINGAVSLLDDLIAEQQAEDEARETAAETDALASHLSHDAPPIAPDVQAPIPLSDTYSGFDEPLFKTGNMKPPAPFTPPFRADDSDAA